MSNVTWVYQQSEPNCYTVGFYAPNGEWHTDSDYSNSGAAAERVHYLNGGNEKTKALELEIEHLRAILENCECEQY